MLTEHDGILDCDPVCDKCRIKFQTVSKPEVHLNIHEDFTLTKKHKLYELSNLSSSRIIHNCHRFHTCIHNVINATSNNKTIIKLISISKINVIHFVDL